MTDLSFDRYLKEFQSQPSPLQEIHHSFAEQTGIQLLIKRDDLIDQHLSGNKWRKLKYNLIEAKKNQYDTLLTFGGAYSNHIFSVAAAGKRFGFRTIGIIRGEEHLPLNSTLEFATRNGIVFTNLHHIVYGIFRQIIDGNSSRSLAVRTSRQDQLFGIDQTKINMGRRQAIHMEPNVTRPGILNQMFIFKFISTHVATNIRRFQSDEAFPLALAWASPDLKKVNHKCRLGSYLCCIQQRCWQMGRWYGCRGRRRSSCVSGGDLKKMRHTQRGETRDRRETERPSNAILN